ncbi:HpcH/HpaI aldolase/citrate lyase family protein [Nocardioides pantholopis]|uniref:HpcH/HpaI aldolase/citrate lyase family protein n=1 Tax=Nocardioides pantholopis TaxID=2483798 RepID=UPI002407BBF6|nr:aldolase/citrate lyase family protein [Nocardioides pantholopis]
MSPASPAGPASPASPAGTEAALTRRTQLFVPANRPERAAKAALAGADAVIVDLEDSVAPAARPAARAGLADAVAAIRAARTGLHVLVRVNADADLAVDVDAAVAAGADGVLVPKVESPDRVGEVDALLDRAEDDHGVPPGRTEVQLLVETPRGLLAVADIAAAGARTVALMLGTEDLSAELEIDPAAPDFDLRWAHGLVLCAARAHGLAPYGLLGTLANFRDLPALERDAQRSRAFGYVGALCIHPAQVPVLSEAFGPTPAEVEHARAVLAALAEAEQAGTAAVQLDGRMVDTPMAHRARRLLARAERA